MFAHKRQLLALSLFLCLNRSWAQNTQNASTVVWEPSAANANNNNNNNNNNNKREVGPNNGLDYASTSIAKSYDPPPEFYRGPGSTASGGSSVASSASGAQLGSVGESLSEAYNKWRHGTGLHDRISVGHYGGGGASSGVGSGGHLQSPHGHVSYAYEGHPYDYAGVGGGGHSGGGGYYGGGGVGSSAEHSGIPFDVYGGRPGHGAHYAHYGGTGGGEYAYLEPHDIASHKGPPELSQKALLAKSFLIPLASAAVLGIAAALVSNPLLLQLGTVSGVGGGFAPVVGKRKRRALRRAYPAHN